MKQLIVLSVALVMLVKPLWPVAEYIMNYDYIVNVLCENKNRPQMDCDGKCYLAKQLAKEAEKNNRNPFGENQSKIELQPAVFFQSLLQFQFEVELQNTTLNNFNTLQVFIATLFASDISHPPEMA